MRTENHIPLLAGLCAGTARGVPLGPLIQKSTDGNLFPDGSDDLSSGNVQVAVTDASPNPGTLEPAI
jgi:hypothetical protein